MRRLFGRKLAAQRSSQLPGCSESLPIHPPTHTHLHTRTHAHAHAHAHARARTRGDDERRKESRQRRGRRRARGIPSRDHTPAMAT